MQINRPAYSLSAPRIPALLVFMLGVLASFMVWRLVSDQEDARLKNEVALRLARIRSQILAATDVRVLSLQRMAFRWEGRGGIPFEEWQMDAESYIAHQPGYRAIVWVDADYIVRWIVPLQGNEAAQNLDLTFEPTRLLAMEEARSTNSVVLTRTIELVVGVRGFLVFVPLFNQPGNEFDGFIVGGFPVEHFLDAVLGANQGFNLRVLDGGVEIYNNAQEEYTVRPDLSASAQVNLYDVLWTLELTPEHRWLDAERSSLPEIFLLVSLALSLLMALVTNFSLSAAANARSLQKSQDRLGATFDALPDLVFILDRNLTYKEILSANRDLMAFDPQELIGGSMKDVLPPEGYERVQAAVDQMLEDGTQPVVEYYVETNAGRLWFEGRAARLHYGDAASELLVWIARDVTMRVSTRLALARSNRELEQFAYVASHDLQEPLRKITAFSERLSSTYAEQLGEQGQDYLARMHSAAERMRELILDLLDFSRLSGRAQPRAPVDLSRIVGLVLDDLQTRIEELSANVEVEELPTVFGDADQLRRLLQNLVANALKYHRPEAAPQIKLSARIVAASPRLGEVRQEAEIAVQDNGIGFESKHAEQIFLPFKRLHARSEYSGTGIGLAICKKIVEAHGGQIWAESAPGKGSSFFFTLPLPQKRAKRRLPSPEGAGDESLEERADQLL